MSAGHVVKGGHVTRRAIFEAYGVIVNFREATSARRSGWYTRCVSDAGIIGERRLGQSLKEAAAVLADEHGGRGLS